MSELKHHSKSPLEIGGGMVLKDVMDLLKSVAHDNEAYEYGNAMVEHINVVRYKRGMNRKKLEYFIRTSNRWPIRLSGTLVLWQAT